MTIRVKIMMVERKRRNLKSSRTTQINNLQVSTRKQLKSTTFKYLPESDTHYRHEMKSKNEWLIKLIKIQGEERE